MVPLTESDSQPAGVLPTLPLLSWRMVTVICRHRKRHRPRVHMSSSPQRASFLLIVASRFASSGQSCPASAAVQAGLAGCSARAGAAEIISNVKIANLNFIANFDATLARNARQEPDVPAVHETVLVLSRPMR